MPDPRPPYRELLREPLREEDMQELWQNIAATAQLGEQRRSPRRALAIGSGLAAATVLVALVVGHQLGARAPSPTAGPLRLSDGSLPQVMDGTAAHSPRVVTLDDGSEIALERGAKVTTLRNDAHAFMLWLERGGAEFSVKPGGPRRWTLETGLATVEVVGTRFRVERNDAWVRVEVTRGVVLVRGDHVPERTRRLGAGQFLTVRRPGTEPVAAVPDAEAGPPDTSAAQDPLPEPNARGDELGERGRTQEPSPEPGRRVAKRKRRWRTLAGDGQYADAYAELGQEGIARETKRASIEELLSLADVARLSGHPAQAVDPLQRAMTAHPQDPRAALAGFSLGKVQLQLERPAQSAHAFERALALGLPENLREDARARAAEAHCAAGDTRRARERARAYLASYPEGRHATRMERLCAEP